MPDLISQNATIQNYGIINVIVGRNGAGKSRFLRDLVTQFRGSQAEYHVSYVSPERGGSFINEAGVDQNTVENQNWFYDQRNRNQSSEFKKSSAALLRQLEVAWGRRLDRDQALRLSDKTFQSEYLDKINNLLLNVRIANNPNGYGFTFENYAGEVIHAQNISSGESEAVSLGTEILNFISNINVNKINVLALDEPDVHLHPDLQVRLARSLISLIEELPQDKRSKVVVVIATHSTSLVCALASSAYTKIGTKHFGNNVVIPRLSNAHFQQTASFFAHPLSQVIAEEPILIIEGDDDSRVLQQAARSSNGRIKVSRASQIRLIKWGH